MREVVTLLRGQRRVVLGLEIEVVDIIVKRDMDGHDYLRVGLRLRIDADSEARSISTGVPAVSWRGYELQLHGGSPDDAMLTVTSAPSAH